MSMADGFVHVDWDESRTIFVELLTELASLTATFTVLRGLGIFPIYTFLTEIFFVRYSTVFLLYTLK